MKVITLLNEKGGVGKTTFSTHIATGLSLRGNRVVLVDTDPQANATSAVGLDKRPDFFDLCVRDAQWKSVLRLVHPDVYSPPAEQSKGSLFAVSSNHESRAVAQLMKKRSVIHNRFMELQSAVDYIIVDTSPTPSMLNEAILLATDYVLIPTDCEAFSALEGVPDSIGHVNTAEEALAEVDIMGARLLGIIPNKYDVRTVYHKGTVEHLVKTYGDYVWRPVPNRIALSETQMTLQFLYAAAPNDPITDHMWRIIDRIEKVKVADA